MVCDKEEEAEEEEEAGGGGERRRWEVQIQKQEPHTMMWGKTLNLMLNY